MRYAARLMRPLVLPTIIAHSGAALYPLRLRVSGGRGGEGGDAGLADRPPMGYALHRHRRPPRCAPSRGVARANARNGPLRPLAGSRCAWRRVSVASAHLLAARGFCHDSVSAGHNDGHSVRSESARAYRLQQRGSSANLRGRRACRLPYQPVRRIRLLGHRLGYRRRRRSGG